MMTRKLLKCILNVTLIFCLLSIHNRMDAQPKSGDWKIQAEFGDGVNSQF